MIHVRTQRDFAQVGLIERAARETLRHQAVLGDPEVTVVITDDDRLRELNFKYLGINEPTDVLSFPSKESDPDTGALYLGDIMISLPRAELQARAAGHSVQDEVQLLVVHGVLHLLGHDHAKPDDKAHMWQAQRQILALLGLKHIKVTE